jgi:rod shape-determining protein MreC
MATSEALKGAEVAEEKAQKKASEIMAERLPGLIDPSLPPDQQPLNDTSNPNPVTHPPMPLHPDRFTPGTDMSTGQSVTGGDVTSKTAPNENAAKKPATPPSESETKPPSKLESKSANPPGKAPAKPDKDATPQRNP